MGGHGKNNHVAPTATVAATLIEQKQHRRCILYGIEVIFMLNTNSI